MSECIHELDPASCSVCSHRGEPVPGVLDPEALGPWFTARYSGRCSLGDEPFRQGDRIRADGEDGYLCARCGLVIGDAP
jgi:hypothetical protein